MCFGWALSYEEPMQIVSSASVGASVLSNRSKPGSEDDHLDDLLITLCLVSVDHLAVSQSRSREALFNSQRNLTICA